MKKDSSMPRLTAQFTEATRKNDNEMSLLDYFAGQAMVAELALQDAGVHFGEYDEHTAPALAKKCYMLASAMLAERAKHAA